MHTEKDVDSFSKRYLANVSQLCAWCACVCLPEHELIKVPAHFLCVSIVFVL